MSLAETQRLPGWRWTAGLVKVLPDCVLLVPTYQRPREIVTLLGRLETLPDPPGKVLVVDGSRDDATDCAVAAWSSTRKLPFDLALVRSPAGLTRQRNVGLDASDGAFVYYLDDDCLPEPGYFSAIRAVFDEDRDGRVGAVCGSFTNELGTSLSLRWRIRFMLGLVPRDAEPGRYYRTATSVPRCLLVPFHGTREVDIVPGGATAYRREVFGADRFSLFFDGYAQGEDLEMSLRIRRRWQLLWSGDALVGHYHAGGGRPNPRWKGRMEVRNRFFIWKRHTPDASWGDCLRFWADIGYVLAWDLVLAVARWDVGHLRHAAGVTGGALECLVRPPRYVEPPVRREFDVDFVELRHNGQATAGAP